MITVQCRHTMVSHYTMDQGDYSSEVTSLPYTQYTVAGYPSPMPTALLVRG